MIDMGYPERQRGKIGRIGVRILSTLRSRKWLLKWLSFYLWAALFIGLLHLTPLQPRATLRNTHLGLFSPDGNTLVTTAGVMDAWECPGPIHLWDVPSGRERLTLAEDWSRITHCEFSPDGKWFAAMNEGNHLKLWETATGKEVADLPLQPEAKHYFTWRFSPNGRFIIYERRCRYQHLEQVAFQFWEIKTQQVRARIEAKYGSMTIAADGKTMNVVHVEEGENVYQYKIERWRFVDDPRVVELMQTLTVSASSFPSESPDLDRIVTVTRIPGPMKEDEIKLLDAATGEVKARVVLNNRKMSLEFLRFSEDGKLLIGHYSNWSQLDRVDRHLVWDVDAGLKEIATCADDPVVSPDGRWLLIWIANGALVQETVPGGKQGELRNAGDEEPNVVSISGSGPWGPWTKGFFSPDSKTVVITGLGYNYDEKDGPMTAWLSNLGVTKRSFPFHYFNVARLWDVEHCKELACFDDCDQVLYAPDGKTLATGHRDGTVRLWDVPPRKPFLAILGTSLVLWLSVLVGVQLWIRLIRWRPLPRLRR